MKINFEFDSIEEMMEFAERLGAKEAPEPVKQEEPIEAQGAAPEPVKDKKYTLVDVREKLSELQKAGKRDKVKELLNYFGASKLPEVPEDKYEELMEKAGEL